MKYLIVSDIHGSVSRLKTVLDFYRKNKCDMLLILGDILNYGPRNGLPDDLNPQAIVALLNSMKDEIIAIRGNCDSEVDQMLLDFPIMSDYTIVVDNGIKLFLTHGHIFNENNLPKGKNHCIIYGHTHLWKLEKKDDIIICNTGSITFPKGGNEPTFCVYENKNIFTYNIEGKLLDKISIEEKSIEDK